MTKIKYVGKRHYRFIIKNIEHILNRGDEIDVNLNKIKGRKMRYFKLVSDIDEKKTLKEIMENWVEKKIKPVII
jgi:hypothetical protein